MSPIQVGYTLDQVDHFDSENEKCVQPSKHVRNLIATIRSLNRTIISVGRERDSAERERDALRAELAEAVGLLRVSSDQHILAYQAPRQCVENCLGCRIDAYLAKRGFPAPALPPLSPAEREARRPVAPAVLANALHGTVHAPEPFEEWHKGRPCIDFGCDGTTVIEQERVVGCMTLIERKSCREVYDSEHPAPGKEGAK